MRSPFPGMDPYLEDPAVWRDVHASFLVEVRVALNATLPPGFAARTEERLYVVEPDRSIYPDLAVSRRLPERPAIAAGGTVAIDPPVVYSAPPEEIHETFVEILALTPGRQVVTVIELLSLANKVPGRGREEYQRKQHDLLRSDIHLIEIDLLRAGERTVAVPWMPEPDKEYGVSLHRGDGAWRFETWFFGLRDRLPRIAVPLTEGQPDVGLDLQQIVAAVYEGGRYGDTIDYSRPPTPPLSPANQAWAQTLRSDS